MFTLFQVYIDLTAFIREPLMAIMGSGALFFGSWASVRAFFSRGKNLG